MNIEKYFKIILCPLVFLYRTYKTYNNGLRLRGWNEFVLGGEILVQLNNPKGKFYIDPRSRLMASVWEDNYEERTLSLLRKLKLSDGIIVNIGSNVGFYAIHLANLFQGKKVFAIEPNPEAFQLLIKNIRINNLVDRILPFNLCVSERSGIIEFAYISGKSEFSSIGNIIQEYSKNCTQEIIYMESKVLGDIVCDEKVALILMDVEGAEKLVIDGSMDILKRDKPILILECADLLLTKFNNTALDLIDTLIKNDYQVHDIEKQQKEIKFPFNGNIIAIPKNVKELACLNIENEQSVLL